MQLEIGSVLEGTVTGLTNFGAFVTFADGQSGMVHISEVSFSFVKDIHEFLSEGQTVKVRVIAVNDGKVSLSIKKAEERKPSSDGFARKRRSSAPSVWQGQKKRESTGEQSFEDMMARFKQESDEKMTALRRSGDSRYNSSRRSGGRQD